MSRGRYPGRALALWAGCDKAAGKLPCPEPAERACRERLCRDGFSWSPNAGFGQSVPPSLCKAMCAGSGKQLPFGYSVDHMRSAFHENEILSHFIYRIYPVVKFVWCFYLL